MTSRGEIHKTIAKSKSVHKKKMKDLKYYLDKERYGKRCLQILQRNMTWMDPKLYAKDSQGIITITQKELMSMVSVKALELRTTSSIARTKRTKQENEKKKKMQQTTEDGDGAVSNIIAIPNMDVQRKRGRPPKNSDTSVSNQQNGVYYVGNITFNEQRTVLEEFRKKDEPEKKPASKQGVEVPDAIVLLPVQKEDDVVIFNSSKSIDKEAEILATKPDVAQSFNNVNNMIKGRQEHRNNRKKNKNASEEPPAEPQIMITFNPMEIEKLTNSGQPELNSVVRKVEICTPERVFEEAKTSAIITDGGIDISKPIDVEAKVKTIDIKTKEDKQNVTEEDEIGKLLEDVDTYLSDEADEEEKKKEESDAMDREEGAVTEDEEDDEGDDRRKRAKFSNEVKEKTPADPDYTSPIRAFLENDINTTLPCYDGKTEIFYDGQKATCESREEEDNRTSKSKEIILAEKDGKKTNSLFTSAPSNEQMPMRNPYYRNTVDSLLFDFFMKYNLTSKKKNDDSPSHNEELKKAAIMTKMKHSLELMHLKQPVPGTGERPCVNNENCMGMHKEFDANARCVLKEYVSPLNILRQYVNKAATNMTPRGPCYMCSHAQASGLLWNAKGRGGSIKKDQIITTMGYETGCVGGYTLSSCLFPGDEYYGIQSPIVPFQIDHYEPVTETVNGHNIKGFRPTYPLCKMDERVYFLNGDGDVVRDLHPDIYKQAIELGCEKHTAISAEDLVSYKEGGIFQTSVKNISLEKSAQMQLAHVPLHMNLRDCKSIDMQVKKQALSGQPGKNHTRNSVTRSKKMINNRDGNTLLISLTHGKVAHVASNKINESSSENETGNNIEKWKMDVCTSIWTGDREINISAAKLAHKTIGQNPPWLMPAPCEDECIYNPDVFIIGDPNRYITPVLVRQMLCGYKDIKGFIQTTEGDTLDDIEICGKKMHWASDLPSKIRYDFVKDAETYLEKIRKYITREHSIFLSFRDIDISTDKDTLKKIYEQLEILNLLRVGQEELIRVISKAKNENEIFELTEVPYPLLFDIGEVYKDMRKRYEFNMKCRKKLINGGIGNVEELYEEKIQLMKEITELVLLKTNATTINDIEHLQTNIEIKNQKFSHIKESLDEVDDVISQVYEACRNPYLFIIKAHAKDVLFAAVWNNIDADSKVKNAQSNNNDWTGWKYGFLDGIESLMSRGGKGNWNAWNSQASMNVNGEVNQKRVFTKVNGLDSNKLDPLFQPFILAPIKPFVFDSSVNRWKNEMPHQRVYTYLNNLYRKHKDTVDKIEQSVIYQQLLPEFLNGEFIDCLIDKLPHGLENYGYVWYPKKMTSFQEMREHKYYCTLVARVQHLDDLLMSENIPINIKKDIVIMQGAHFGLISFMCESNKFSDAELNESANETMDLGYDILDRLRTLRNERNSNDSVCLRELRYIDVYMPNYAWSFHQGELPDLKPMIMELRYNGSKLTKSDICHDPAYDELLELLDKTLELPMKGRQMNKPLSKACRNHPMIFECMKRIFHCSLGAYYDHSCVIMSFPVRLTLYREFCFKKMDQLVFCSWLYGHETYDHVLQQIKEEDHNHFTNTVLKEYVHFMITKIPGLCSMLDSMHYMPEIRHNVRIGMDGIRQVINDCAYGVGRQDFRFHKRYMYYVGMRIKNTEKTKKQDPKNKKESRKGGLSACFYRVGKNENVIVSEYTKSGEKKSTVESDTWQSRSTDPEMFFQGSFPLTGEAELVDYQYNNLWEKVGRYGPSRLYQDKNLDVLSRLNVQTAKELKDRIKALRRHEEVMLKKQMRTIEELAQERATFKYDFRKYFKKLHGSYCIGKFIVSENKCPCPECVNDDPQVKYDEYQKSYLSNEIGLLHFSYPVMDIVENMCFWAIAGPNHQFQWRKKGVLLCQYITAFCPMIDNTNENNEAFQVAKEKITDDELSMIGNQALILGDNAEITFDWMVKKPLYFTDAVMDLLTMAVNQFIGDSYTIDILNAFYAIADINPRAYHLLKYYFMIACRNRVIRKFRLSFNSIIKICEALQKKTKAMGINEKIPSHLFNALFCEEHGCIKREPTDFSSKAVNSIGDPNTRIDLATGKKYCKKPDNKEPGVMAKYCNDKKVSKLLQPKTISDTMEVAISSVMDLTNLYDDEEEVEKKPINLAEQYEKIMAGMKKKNPTKTSSDNTASAAFFSNVIDKLDLDCDANHENQANKKSKKVQTEKKTPGKRGRKKKEDTLENGESPKWAKFRVELQQQIDERCAKTPLRDINLFYDMLVLYDKSIRLCEVCASVCFVTKDKFTEFGFCCGVCTRKIRLNMPRNISAYLGFRCAACNPKILYRCNNVARYVLYDDTCVLIRRFRYVYLCANHDKKNIGKYPCLMSLTNVLSYAIGNLVCVRTKKGVILVENKYKENKMDQKMANNQNKPTESGTTNSMADSSDEYRKKERTIMSAINQVNIPMEWYWD